MANYKARRGKHVIKLVDEQVTTSTTQQNDDELFIALNIPSHQYHFKLSVFINATTNSGIDFAFTVPSGTTGIRSNATLSLVPSATTDIATVASESVASANLHILIYGIILTSTTLGNLQFTFAQKASHADATKVLKGSMLQVFE